MISIESISAPSSFISRASVALNPNFSPGRKVTREVTLVNFHAKIRDYENRTLYVSECNFRKKEKKTEI